MTNVYFAIRTSDIVIDREYTLRVRRFDRIESILFKSESEAVQYLVDKYDAKNMFDQDPSDYDFFFKASYVDRNRYEHELKFKIERVFVEGETDGKQ